MPGIIKYKLLPHESSTCGLTLDNALPKDPDESTRKVLKEDVNDQPVKLQGPTKGETDSLTCNQLLLGHNSHQHLSYNNLEGEVGPYYLGVGGGGPPAVLGASRVGSQRPQPLATPSSKVIGKGAKFKPS